MRGVVSGVWRGVRPSAELPVPDPTLESAGTWAMTPVGPHQIPPPNHDGKHPPHPAGDADWEQHPAFKDYTE